MRILLESFESDLKVTIKSALCHAAEILELPLLEEAWPQDDLSPPDELNILLCRKIPTLPPPAQVLIISELIEQRPKHQGAYKICSAVSLIFELVKTAQNPKFKSISQEVAKPLIKAIQAIPTDPSLALPAFASISPATYVRRTHGRTCLLLLDIQPRVFKAFPFDCDWLLENVLEVIKYAKLRKWEIVITEQVPDKLGGTEERIKEAAGEKAEKFGKSAFSAASLLTRFDHIVILGIETHICVALTAEELALAEKQVTIITDGVASSCPMSDWSLVPRLTSLATPVQFINRVKLISEEI